MNDSKKLIVLVILQTIIGMGIYDVFLTTQHVSAGPGYFDLMTRMSTTLNGIHQEQLVQTRIMKKQLELLEKIK